MNKQQTKAMWAKRNPDSVGRKKGDKFYNQPHITDGGHNMKTGFYTKEVMDAHIKHSSEHARTSKSPDLILKSGHIWSVKKQKFVSAKK